MFSTKLTIVAVAAAFAVASVSAAEQSTSNLRFTVLHEDAKNSPPKKDACVAGWTYVSVEGTGKWFCTENNVCVAQNKSGNCPEAQWGLPYGSYCDKIEKTGVYGCKAMTKEMAEKQKKPFCKGPGESPMSVEGVKGVFCVTGQACAGVPGSCPRKGQTGLQVDAVCDTVKTGVLGCKLR
jgi:hypothetical protein